MTAMRCDNVAKISFVHGGAAVMRAATRSATLAIWIMPLSLAAFSAIAADDPALVREQKTVMVDGKPDSASAFMAKLNAH